MKQAIDPALEHEIVNKATGLLSILSKKDALSIFLLAKDGLKAETDTPQKIGLTRKQYYTRLKQLVDAGLIDKSGDIYLHTTLGTFVHQKHVLELLEHMKNVKQMKMIDTLKRTSQFSEEDIASFVSKLTGASLATNGTLAKQVQQFANMIWTYEDMINLFVERAQFANQEILLATRYLNEIIINKVMLRAKSGIQVKVIADSRLIQNYIKKAGEGLKTLDKNALERIKVVTNPWYPSNITRRFAEIPFCFVVYDGKEVGIELVDSKATDNFKASIFVRDVELARNMQELYSNLWNNAEEDLAKLIDPEVVSQLRSLTA